LEQCDNVVAHAAFSAGLMHFNRGLSDVAPLGTRIKTDGSETNPKELQKTTIL
jgi:hypothetical protein